MEARSDTDRQIVRYAWRKGRTLRRAGVEQLLSGKAEREKKTHDEKEERREKREERRREKREERREKREERREKREERREKREERKRIEKMKEKNNFPKNVSRPSNPPDELAQNVSKKKKIPVGRIIPPFFVRKFRI